MYRYVDKIEQFLNILEIAVIYCLATAFSRNIHNAWLSL